MMKVKDLLKVCGSATSFTVTANKPLDEGGEYLKSYGIFEEFEADYGNNEVLCIYPATKDVMQITIKVEEKPKPKMNKPRYCGGTEQDEMEARGWRVMVKEHMNETAEEMFERLIKSYSKVKIYWDTTRVRGLHSYFAMVKR